jgi:hypothetical protein
MADYPQAQKNPQHIGFIIREDFRFVNPQGSRRKRQTIGGENRAGNCLLSLA